MKRAYVFYIILSIIILFPKISNGQEDDFRKYYTLVNQANDAYDSVEYQLAESYFDQAFKLVKQPFARNLERAVEISIKNQNCQKATDCAKAAARVGFIVKDTLISSLSILCNEKIDKAFLEAESKKALSLKNQTFIRLIDSLFNIDQNFRNNSKAFADKGNVDSLNMYRLLEGIRQFGFPSEDKVGYDATFKVFILFLHADFDKENTRFGPILLAALQSGKFRPIWYAQVADRRSNYSGKPFLYYQIPFSYDKLSIEEKQAVTERRKVIGLRSVEKTIAYKFDTGGRLTTQIKE